MANDEKRVPPDEWLVNSRDLEREPPRTPTIDEVHRLAQSLDPDERLRLVTRLWAGLPTDHRSALVSLHLEEDCHPRDRFDRWSNRANSKAIRRGFWDPVFDRSNATKLYSAPRRFDLATIFVVTAAFSLMLGGLTALGAPPIVKVAFGGLVTIIAVAQALFLKVANPRGVSIVAGAAAYTVFSWCVWLAVPHVFPNSFFFVTVINGIVGGSILGYLLGTLVGGVFLVADLLRGKFEGRVERISESPEVKSGIELGGENNHERT